MLQFLSISLLLTSFLHSFCPNLVLDENFPSINLCVFLSLVSYDLMGVPVDLFDAQIDLLDLLGSSVLLQKKTTSFSSLSRLDTAALMSELSRGNQITLEVVYLISRQLILLLLLLLRRLR